MFTRITRNTGEPDFRLAVIITAVGLLAGLATDRLACAAENGVVVQYHAGELNQPETVARLYERLTSAAARVCASPGHRSLRMRAAEARCEKQALDGAVDGIGHPMLSRIHADNGGEIRVAGS
jgi:UrcA family protein